LSLADLTGLVKSTTAYQNYQNKTLKKSENKLESDDKMQSMDVTKKFTETMFKLCNLNQEDFQADLPIAVAEYNFFVLLSRISI